MNTFIPMHREFEMLIPKRPIKECGGQETASEENNWAVVFTFQ
jgi:hypothetical protein